MKHYLLEDDDTGEIFIVEATDKKSAKEIAKEFFDNPRLIREISEEEAENSGLDEY